MLHMHLQNVPIKAFVIEPKVGTTHHAKLQITRLRPIDGLLCSTTTAPLQVYVHVSQVFGVPLAIVWHVLTIVTDMADA